MISLAYFMCILVVATNSQLISQDVSREMEDGSTDNSISCRAKLGVADTLFFSKDGTPVYLLRVISLDNVLNLTLSSENPVSYTLSDPTATNVEANIILRIHKVVNTTAGSYICTYTSGGDTTTVKTQVTVVGPPKDIMLTSRSQGVRISEVPIKERLKYMGIAKLFDVHVNIGVFEEVKISCSATATPEAMIYWITKSTGAESLSNTILLDRSPDDLPRTEYVCAANNQYGWFNVTIRIKEEYKPEFIAVTPATDFYPAPGSNFRAHCNFTSKPDPSVFFVKVVDGRDGADKGWDRENSISDGNELTLEVNLERDVGEYRCIAQNIHGVAEGVFYIHGKPSDVKVSVSEIYGDSVDLVLEAKSHIATEFNITVRNEQHEITSDKEASRSEIITETIDVVPKQGNILQGYSWNDLKPETQYTVFITAENAHGMDTSEIVTFTTEQATITKPNPIVHVTPTTVSIPSHAEHSFTLCYFFTSAMLVLVHMV